MVPKLHAKGRSFKGAAAYLLHDKGRAKSSERVAWTETRNLATDDPHVAWKIMAATAVDQKRLKERAGIKNTGRKSAEHVLHLTLSWHPDEKDNLSREEMLRAANGALRALKAEDRQVLFVSHDDEPQPHLHVLLNRVSPEDGRMLSSSKEKLALSRWAEAYEKERGQIRCEERVINNAARDRGEFTRGEPDRPRHLFELKAANDNRPDAGRIRDEQREADAEVARKEREAAQRHAQAWERLAEQHRERLRDINQKAREELGRRQAEIHERFRPRWRELFRAHEEEVRAFEKKEGQVIGRISNAIRAIDFGAIMRSGERRRAISEAFGVIASRGARLAGLKREQERHVGLLAGQQRKAEDLAEKEVRRDRKAALAKNRRTFKAERSDLMLGQRADHAVKRARWAKRRQDRRAAWDKQPPRDQAKGRSIEAMKERLRERYRKRGSERDRGKDRER